MPIRIPDALPAKSVLESENIFVMPEHRAAHQDIRPLRIIILNLMPTKIVTETQLLRCLSNSPLQVEVELLQTVSHISKNTSLKHLLSFYKSFDEVRDNHYDGMIITGAPVELMTFEEVDYWPELCEILDWSLTNVYSTYYICWGAQAALWHHFGVPKYRLSQKKFGVFSHRLLDRHAPLFYGYDDVFMAPHSRHTEIRAEDILAVPELRLMAASDEAGVYIVQSLDGRQIFVTGHPEYDADTLNSEYLRDVGRGLEIDKPIGYFPGDDPNMSPVVNWRAHGNLLYSNWLNFYVYQSTPFDLSELK